MKFSIRTVILKCLLFSLVLSMGCTNSEKHIDDLTVGPEGSNHGYLGQVLLWGFSVRSMEADDSVILNITPINGKGWSYEKVYEGVFFQQNKSMKDSLQIPINADVGTYKFALKQISEDKIIYTKEAKLSLSVDNSAPYASALDVGLNAKGTDLHLEAELAAARRIKSVEVKIQSGDEIRIFDFNTPPLKGSVTHTFHEHIDMHQMPNGSYQVTLTVVDFTGKQSDVSGKFEK
ncbi:MAG: hypothetical protein ACTJHT_09430 [Sphingobacterium sp.]